MIPIGYNGQAKPQKAAVISQSSTETLTAQTAETVALFVGLSAWLYGVLCSWYLANDT